MKKNGYLTKREYEHVCKSMQIVDGWLRHEMETKPEEEREGAFWDFYKAHREMMNDLWMLTDEEG